MNPDSNTWNIFNRSINKYRAILFAFVIIALVLVGLLILNRPAKLVIESENGADIFVTTTSGGEFQKIGTTKATFSTRKVPQDVFVMVTRESKKTIIQTRLTERKTITRKVELAPVLSISKITDGSVSNMYVDKNNIQGVLPENSRLINFGTQSSVPIRSAFAVSPQVSKVFWYDSDNFVYKSYDGRIGRFVDSIDITSLGLASVLKNGNVPAPYGEEGEVGRYFIDIAKTDKKPLVLLSKDKLFTSGDMGDSVSILANLEQTGSDQRVFTDENFVYYFVGDETADYASELDDKSIESGDTEHGNSKIYKYNYSGELKDTFVIESDNASSVVSVSNTTYVLSSDVLTVHKDGKSWQVTPFSPYIRGLVEYDNRVFILAGDGLWEVSADGSELRVLANFPTNTIGVVNSLMRVGDKVMFSTGPKPAQPKVQGSVYSVSINP